MRTLSILVVSIFAWAVAAPVYAAELIVSDASGRAGETVAITVSLNQQGDRVQNTQNDIHFDSLVQIRATMSGRPDCMHPSNVDNWTLGVGFRPTGCAPGVDCTAMRAQLLDYEDPTLVDVLGDGAGIYTCNVTIDAKAPPGDYPLTCDGTIMIRNDGTQVQNASCHSGTITVLPPPPELIVSDASGHPGETVTITVSLDAQGDPVTGTQNDIHFDPLVQIRPTMNGRADCVGIQQDPPNWRFFARFGPDGCVPGVDCNGIRANFINYEVPSSDLADRLNDGASLYTCNVTIDAKATPGAYALTCDGTILTDSFGIILPNPSCRSGTITVLPPPPELAVSDASGHPGETVTFDVRLNSNGTGVFATQNDIAFGTDVAIAPREGLRPDCVLGENIRSFCDSACLSLAFGPYQCTEGNCDYVRALLLPGDISDPIPDGTLYTCTVAIAPDAQPGGYPLLCTNTILSDTAGTAGTACHSGVVTVLPGCAVSDCNADGEVTIDEVITGINIALEITPLDACAVMDIDGNGAVTIDELVVAYNQALFGCGGN